MLSSWFTSRNWAPDRCPAHQNERWHKYHALSDSKHSQDDLSWFLVDTILKWVFGGCINRDELWLLVSIPVYKLCFNSTVHLRGYKWV